MKKKIVLGLAVVVTLAASVTAFANVAVQETKITPHEEFHVGVASQGQGSCRHAGCKCSWYNRAEGGAGKCVCGHWDYVHN